MIKVGVIGVGTMGKHHARVYAELPDAELVGVADVNKDVVHTIAERYNTEAFINYKELLKRECDEKMAFVEFTNYFWEVN